MSGTPSLWKNPPVYGNEKGFFSRKENFFIFVESAFSKRGKFALALNSHLQHGKIFFPWKNYQGYFQREAKTFSQWSKERERKKNTPLTTQFPKFAANISSRKHSVPSENYHFIWKVLFFRSFYHSWLSTKFAFNYSIFMKLTLDGAAWNYLSSSLKQIFFIMFFKFIFCQIAVDSHLIKKSTSIIFMSLLH